MRLGKNSGKKHHILMNVRTLNMPKRAKYDWGKTSSSKYQKFETRLTHKTAISSNSQDSVYIDVAQSLSLQNRKLVRQGHVFDISGLKIWTNDGSAQTMDVSVSVLPRTWMMFNAYKKPGVYGINII